MGVAAATASAGFAVGWWLFLIGSMFTVFAAIGFVFEYYRGNFSPSFRQQRQPPRCEGVPVRTRRKITRMVPVVNARTARCCLTAPVIVDRNVRESDGFPM